MGLFGRRKRDADTQESVQRADGADLDSGADFDDEHDELTYGSDGPWDSEDAPDDDAARLDLGSVLVPVPDGAQLQVEMDPSGPVRAVHVLTPVGQFTVNAYAAPRTGGLWKEVCGELAEQLRGDGATVRSTVGDWGQELTASLGEVSLRFVGVDGPRWMLRGVVAGPPESAEASALALRDLVRNTVVVRGSQPMPVRTPLQIDLPTAIAEHIAAAAEEQQA